MNKKISKNTITFKGITKKQIELLKENKLPITAALGLMGGIATQYAFTNVKDAINEEEIIDETTNDQEKFDFEVPINIEFSDVVTDDMTFGEAFNAARADTDGAGFFNWRGNTYHTLNKEEWDALSDEEKQEFYDKIKEHADFDKGDFNKIDTDDDEDQNEDIDKDEDEDEDKDNDEDNDENDQDNNENIPDEISFDDIIFEDEDLDTNEDLEEFVTVDEIGDTVDIIEGLNDGEATEEAEGIEGGVEYEDTDFENTSDSDIDYDDDFEQDILP